MNVDKIKVFSNRRRMRKRRRGKVAQLMI